MGIRLIVEGHAGDDRPRLCAGVSTLLATALQTMHGTLAAGAPGYFDCCFIPYHFDLARWTIKGLKLLAESYPGVIEFDLQDSILGA